MSWWDDLGNWAGYGITHPETWFTSPQYGRTPEETAAYNAAHSNPEDELAKAAEQVRIDHLNAQQPYFGTGNPTVDKVIDTIGGAGVHVSGTFGNGGAPNFTGGNVAGLVNVGTQQSTTVPHTAEQIASDARQHELAGSTPAPTDALVGPQLGEDYRNQMGPPNLGHYAQDGETANGLTYSAGQGKWVSPADYAAYKSQNTVPASTTPAGTSTADLRVGDHRTYNGVFQTWNGVGWNNGNSAAPPGNSVLTGNQSGPVAPVQTPIGQVNTTTQNPLMTPSQWDSLQEQVQADYRAYMGVGLSAEDAMSRAKANHPGSEAPKPTGNPVNSAVPNGAPLTSAQNPAPPSAGTTGAAGAAAGADGLLGWLKGLGIDGNTAAILASGGAGMITTYLASKAQTDAATAANTTQQAAFDKALGQQQTQFDKTNEINKGIYDTQQANLKPWLTAGTDAVHELSSFDIDHPDFSATPFAANSNYHDPSYQFRLDEGVKALQNSAAAKGGLLSGNTLRGITDYAQNSASQEYNNAFNRFNTDRNTKLNELQSLAGIGQTANQQANNSGSSYGAASQQEGQTNSNAMGSYITGAGNAAANASNAIGNANASGYVTGQNILNNMMSQYLQNQGQTNANNFMKTLFS